MAGKLFTPITLWEDFKYNLPINAVTVNEETKDGVTFSDVILNGRVTESGEVKIYAKTAVKTLTAKTPAVLIMPAYNQTVDQALLEDFAKQGYFAIMVDYRGENEDSKYHTVYPDDVKYANATYYEAVIHSVVEDVKSTCWYEWVAVAKHVLYYLKNELKIKKIGGYGIKHGATCLWQLGAVENGLDCIVNIGGTGWRAYRGFYKFSDIKEPELDDEKYMYIAGIDAQSYAKYLTCPMLSLSCTNSKEFDLDRVYDTLSRVDEKIYKIADYSVIDRDCIGYHGKVTATLFFDKYLKEKEITLPNPIEISTEIIDKNLTIKVKCDDNNLKSVTLYCAEETLNPSLRDWNNDCKKVSEDDGEYVFQYQPYGESSIAFFFARANYENGFSIASPVIAKKFKAEDVICQPKSAILFNTRDTGYKFYQELTDKENSLQYVMQKPIERVVFKKGPMDIMGCYSKNNVLSFKPNIKKYKPKEGSILMFDVYTKTACEVVVKIISDMYSEKETIYYAKANLTGGEVWHDVRIDSAKFKTEEGKILKDFSTVNAMVIACREEFLINNVLWV